MTRTPLPPRAAFSALGLAVPGAVLIALGWADAQASRRPLILAVVGCTALLAAFVLILRNKGDRNIDAAYEQGREDGYRRGWDDGRRIGKPVVIPLRPHKDVERDADAEAVN